MSYLHMIEGSGMVQIRPAVTGDLPAIAALLSELFRIERDFTPDLDRQLKGLRLLARMPERVLIWVAIWDNCVVGTCAVHDGVSTAEGTQVAVLEDLIVAERFRRKGIGRALLKAAEKHAWHHGARRLQLLTDRNNKPALDFYARHSWEPTQLVALRRRPTCDELHQAPHLDSAEETRL